MANEQKIEIKNTEVLINDQKVRLEFNRQMKDCKDLRNNMRSLNSELRQLQDEEMKKVGVGREDLGLQQHQSASQ